MREFKKIKTFVINDTNNYEDNNKKITLRLSKSLIQTIKNIVISSKAGNDFRHNSVSHLIRNALEGYKNGTVKLWSNPIIDKKQPITIEIPKELFGFYSSLPRGSRHEICEKVINSYINQGF
jgi:predicted DNA binding CopG/RHH family protein